MSTESVKVELMAAFFSTPLKAESKAMCSYTWILPSWLHLWNPETGSKAKASGGYD